MAKVKQLTVSLENRPGTLAHMAKVLADAKVNIVCQANGNVVSAPSASGSPMAHPVA
jgi:ACT domain-containing protein